MMDVAPRSWPLAAALTIAVALLLVGCTTPPTSAEVEAATVYFPPQVKYLDEPDWVFTSAERQRALRAYREQADTLFELVIDGEGKVKRARLLRTDVRKEYHEDLVAHARHLGFTKDTDPGRYRAFYFPVDYRNNRDFRWVDR